VKAFNTTFAGTLVAGQVGGQQLDVLIVGDDEAAKQQVSRRAADGGLRPIDVGPLRRARQLEQLGLTPTLGGLAPIGVDGGLGRWGGPGPHPVPDVGGVVADLPGPGAFAQPLVAHALA
jgi:hypothetical protein